MSKFQRDSCKVTRDSCKILRKNGLCVEPYDSRTLRVRELKLRRPSKSLLCGGILRKDKDIILNGRDPPFSAVKNPIYRERQLDELALPAFPRPTRDPYEYYFSPKNLPGSRTPKFWNNEVESSFWRDKTFCVKKSALEYEPSEHIKKLAKPKKYPAKLHCPAPVKDEVHPSPRIRMTEKQWCEHRKRLKYLSDPSFKEKRVEKVEKKLKELESRECSFEKPYSNAGCVRVHGY